MKTTNDNRNNHAAVGDAIPSPASFRQRVALSARSPRLSHWVNALCIFAMVAGSAQAVPLDEALDTSGLTWSTGGDVPWEGIKSDSHDGEDSARSGVITNRQETWMETTVEGAGNLSFWWKVSSERRSDRLAFFIDGVFQTSPISGNVGWTQKYYVIPPGSHTLRWRYVKDKTDSSGDDAAWVDQVVFENGSEIVLEKLDGTALVDGLASINFGLTKRDGTSKVSRRTIKNVGAADLTDLAITIDGANAEDFSVSDLRATSLATSESTTFKITFKPKGSGPRTASLHIASNDGDESPFDVTLTGEGAISLPKALDTTDLTWITGGNSPWLGQSAVTRGGADAAQSSKIKNSQQSQMETTVTGPGTLRFWWKVSSEGRYDFLEFYIDGQLQSGSISGEVDWKRKTHAIPEGEHTLRWRYMKDSSVSTGADAAWVDKVTFTTIIDTP